MIDRNRHPPCAATRWGLAPPGLVLALAVVSGCGESGRDTMGAAGRHTGGNPPVSLATLPPPLIHAQRSAKPPAATSTTSACYIQGMQRLSVAPRRALGTEPFWSALIHGRCVIYATPENQHGTRLWTRYSRTARSETWIGALDGRPFELVLRPQDGCSDGMSDHSYPFAAEIVRHNEKRSGCATNVGSELPQP